MTPRILGEDDGKFRIIHNAMGVPGLHVAVNVFEPELHLKLFQNAVFTTNTVPFVHDSPVPLQQANLHPLSPPTATSPWPDDWHRLINAVRDCGLFSQATIPDNAYGLTYDRNSCFPCHHDGAS